MPNYDASITIPVELTVIRQPLDTFHDAMALLPKEPEEPFALGFSRKNWFQYTIEEIAEVYQLENLEYFSKEAAALDSDQIQRAISDIESLLTSIAEKPGDLIDLTGQTAFSEEQILDCINSINVELDPYSLSDDGDNILYFIDYLKAHLHILGKALREQKGIIFAQIG